MVPQTQNQRLAAAMGGAKASQVATAELDRHSEDTEPQNLAEELFAGTDAKLAQGENLDLSNDLFRQALEQRNASGVQTAEDPNQTEAILRREKLIREQHDKLNPTQENVVELHARKEAEAKQEQEILSAQLKTMIEQKEIPEVNRPKIVEVRVVNAGERRYVIAPLFEKAWKEVEAFVKNPGPTIAKGRQARRGEGLVASAEQDQEEQMKMHHEFSVNGGA